MGSSATTLADTSALLRALLRSYQVHGASPALLPELAMAVRGLAVPCASRAYRRHFTENYVMLLGDQLYRAEILSAAMLQEEQIWVNGTAHRLSETTLGKGLVLKNCFWDLGELLREASQRARYPLGRFRASLAAFDAIWVLFEEAYVKELIFIEGLCKVPLESAISLEFALLELEFPDVSQHRKEAPAGDLDVSSLKSSTSSLPPAPPTDPTWRLPPSDLHHLAESARSRGPRRSALESLVRQVAQLNRFANRHGKGRSDLSLEVLSVAADMFFSEDKVQEMLAQMVLEGFLGVRQYLYKASQRMLWVDPQLANNVELDRCLVAWEDAWELGTSFLMHPEMRVALCEVAAEAAGTQEFHAEFAALVEDQDAELFLILPRLLLLSSLREHSYRVLLQSLVERFDLNQLEQDFVELKASHAGDDLNLWKFLVSRAMEGPGSGGDASEKFLRRMEGLSMQLQRQKPERWNRFSRLLLQCVTTAMHSQLRVLSL